MQCELTAVTVRSVTTFAWGDQLGDLFVDSLDISVPLMVNFKPLGQGEELVVFWKSKGQKQVSKVIVTTWLDQAAKLTRKGLITLASRGGVQFDSLDSAGHLA